MSEQRKWSDEDRSRIKLMRASGMSFDEIAAEFGARNTQVQAQHYIGTPPVLGPHLSYVPMDKIGDKVLRPGIDKHLIPLCLYMGTISFGRVHRWWNFALAAMEQGAASTSDVVKLSHHPEFSHLCGLPTKTHKLAVQGFFTRLRDNPGVTDNIPGMTEWAREVLPHPWALYRVPRETFERRSAPWRLYKKRPAASFKLNEVAAKDACYPFIAHDPKKVDGADLVALVNKAVPKGLHEDIRADICQDLICAILMGEIKREDLQGSVKDFIKVGRKMFADKWSFVSLDAPILGMNGEKTMMDMI